MSSLSSRISGISARQLLSFVIIILPVGVLLYAFATNRHNLPKPKAVNGFLDLSGWNEETQGNIPLNGEWKFYWNHLLTPEEAAAGKQENTMVMSVPGIWNNKGFPSGGYATYLLDVKISSPHRMRALSILTVSNAYKLWVNNRLVATNGTVGTDEAHSAPAYAPKVITFIPDTDHLRFIMQVSNFTHCKGGFWLPVEMGTVEQVQNERDSRVILEMFLFGCLFIMALYHFSLYFLRRSDASTLYFGLMCAVIGVRSLLTGENLINNLVPGLDWFAARKIEYLLTFVSAPVYVTFSRFLYRTEWNRIMYRIIVGFGIGLCLFVLVMPTRIYTNTSYVFTGYAWLTGMYTLIVFYRAARRRQEGAGIFLATSIFFLLTIVNDTLNQLEIVHTGLYLSFGLLIVTFAQAFVLSSRSATVFRNLEIYSRTFRKFVPAQFLDKIAKDGIGSIKAGNAEKVEVTVLFSDIRSFTSIAENMSPDEVFRMLNKYLSHVEPPIRANNGFVDKYMGDGIMALFEKGNGHSSAHNAVQAAIEMQEAQLRFNEARRAVGRVPLDMGVGLHAGEVIIGTLGGNERMDSTAIGDAVNLASRIEGMTKIYGTPLLASEHTIGMIEDPDAFVFRFVDNVVPKGKVDPVGIWEVLGKKNDSRLAKQISVLPDYNRALEEYRRKNLNEAKLLFEKCAAAWPEDKVCAIYVQRCTA